ncbi:MAG: hypothetical protein ACI4X9_03975 [Kiritimatiellia bacterium]
MSIIMSFHFVLTTKIPLDRAPALNCPPSIKFARSINRHCALIYVLFASFPAPCHIPQPPAKLIFCRLGKPFTLVSGITLHVLYEWPTGSAPYIKIILSLGGRLMRSCWHELLAKARQRILDVVIPYLLVTNDLYASWNEHKFCSVKDGDIRK